MYSAANICGSFKANISHYSAESLLLAPLYARLLSFLQEVAAFHFKFFVVFSKSEKKCARFTGYFKIALEKSAEIGYNNNVFVLQTAPCAAARGQNNRKDDPLWLLNSRPYSTFAS